MEAERIAVEMFYLHIFQVRSTQPTHLLVTPSVHPTPFTSLLYVSLSVCARARATPSYTRTRTRSNTTPHYSPTPHPHTEAYAHAHPQNVCLYRAVAHTHILQYCHCERRVSACVSSPKRAAHQASRQAVRSKSSSLTRRGRTTHTHILRAMCARARERTRQCCARGEIASFWSQRQSVRQHI